MLGRCWAAVGMARGGPTSQPVAGARLCCQLSWQERAVSVLPEGEGSTAVASLEMGVSCFQHVLICILPHPRSSAWARDHRQLSGLRSDPRSPIPGCVCVPCSLPRPIHDGCAWGFTCCACTCPGLSGKRDRGSTLDELRARLEAF